MLLTHSSAGIPLRFFSKYSVCVSRNVAGRKWPVVHAWPRSGFSVLLSVYIRKESSHTITVVLGLRCLICLAATNHASSS